MRKKGAWFYGRGFLYFILLICLSCLLSLSFLQDSLAKKRKPYWRFDSVRSCREIEDLNNYRTCTKSIRLPEETHKKEEDYKDLLISGSGQLPLDSFGPLYEDLKKQAPEGSPIYLLDLRQESHGFLDEYSVSLHGKDHNDHNKGMVTVEVLVREMQDLLGLYKVPTKIRSGNNSITGLKDKTICSDRISVEETVARKAGFIYIRFAAQDHKFPQKETVDEFIRFYRRLPEKAWLHFHCLAGNGRTSVFMIMYDLMRNPDLSMKRAANRQYMIGGRRIVASSGKDEWSGKISQNARSQSLLLFSQYVRENHTSNYRKPYSQWLEENNK